MVVASVSSAGGLENALPPLLAGFTAKWPFVGFSLRCGSKQARAIDPDQESRQRRFCARVGLGGSRCSACPGPASGDGLVRADDRRSQHRVPAAGRWVRRQRVSDTLCGGHADPGRSQGGRRRCPGGSGSAMFGRTPSSDGLGDAGTSLCQVARPRPGPPGLLDGTALDVEHRALGRGPQFAVAVPGTGLMWANMLRAFQVGKARVSHVGPSSRMRESMSASAQVSWPACHLTKASASAVM